MTRVRVMLLTPLEQVWQLAYSLPKVDSAKEVDQANRHAIS
jgi:hypothetical protein